MLSSVIYKANVGTKDAKKNCLGSAATTWKARYNNHKTSFRLRHKEKDTALSGYIWQLKDKKISYEIKWKILKVVPSYTKE